MGYDLVVTGGRVVLAGTGVTNCDVAVRDGRIAAVGHGLAGRPGTRAVLDARGKLVLPGALDSHYHLGVYRDLADDAASETRSALVGGVTSLISYFRTGGHYLGRGGRYRDVLPSVVETVTGRSYADFGFHVAPMDAGQLDELPWLVDEAGIGSFKFYFHYRGGEGTATANGAATKGLSHGYDLGHLYAVMEAVAVADRRAGPGTRVSLSLHCENAELIRHFGELLADSALAPLERYSRSRPTVSERLSIHEAGVLADHTGVRINLVHLSSADAVDAARQLRTLYPTLDVRLETTVHHLCLTAADAENLGGAGKVNPPLRSAADRDALWAAVADGTIDWVASDHACCLEAMKLDVDSAVPGFGGAALIYPALLTEGHVRRGLPLERVAELAATNAARAYGCQPRKGAIRVGADADLVVVDLDRELTVTPELLQSAQDFSPLAGRPLRGWPEVTVLRGRVVFSGGVVHDPPHGVFLPRPVTTAVEPVVTR